MFQEIRRCIQVNLENFGDAAKVKVWLRKLDTAEHERYNNFILSKNPKDLSFNQTVVTLLQTFGEQSSLFSIRYQCLKLAKAGDGDWVQHNGILNRERERFELSAITGDQFKCLVFVCSLKSPEDANVRTKILSEIEQCPNITQEVTGECQRLVNLKPDTSTVENSGQPPFV